MCKMYGIIEKLCADRGIKPGRLCSDIGISRGILSDLKTGRTKKLSAENMAKISSYFGVSADFLLGDNEKAPTVDGERGIADAKAAFFDGYGENLSEEEKDELWEDARIYARFKAQQKK